MGKRQKDVYQNATKWQVIKYKIRMFFRTVFVLGLIASVLWGTYKIGGELNPSTIVASRDVIVEVPTKAPILERIAKCESNGSHYDKNGQVALNANTNKSVDIGLYQINNKAWGKKATDMGLNLFIEKDNKVMAQYIYENYGTEPWYSSKSCWNK